MNIKVSQFCSLATSASWQAWLYNLDSALYSVFVEKLRKARNCTENAEVMKSMLDELDSHDYSEKLAEFLRINHPHVLVNEALVDNNIFPDYVHGILTYPRRLVVTNDDIDGYIREFSENKLVVEYAVVGNTAYIEYLEPSDSDLVDMIGEFNWLIRKWKNRNQR